MAHLTPGFSLLGSISNLSAYKRRDLDKVIIRTKGGPSKEKIRRSPSFEKLRKNNAEFGGRSTASGCIRSGLWPLTLLADYNIAGSLNSLLIPIQSLDTENERGQRSIRLSLQPGLLTGFSLNRHYPFDSIIRNPLTYNISRETLSAQVEFPALLPSINFHVSGNHPLYSFVVVLALVPDLFFNGSKYVAHQHYDAIGSTFVESSWYPVLKGSSAMCLEVSLPFPPPDTTFSLMLSVGLRFGTISEGEIIQQVKHAGCAKILAMA